MTVTNMVAAATGACSRCPHGTAYCISPHGPHDVCEGPQVTLPAPPRHASAAPHLVTARMQDFGFFPGSDKNTPDPMVSLDTPGDALDLHDPAEILALADSFAAFAEQLRGLGHQLAGLRAASRVQIAGAAK